jgi:nucleoside-triphosphatase THEP1
LISNTHNIHEQLFVIDEVGKLELKGEGFDSGLKKLFSLHQQNREKIIVLIVRDYLVDEVIKRYNISANIIDISEKSKFLNKFRFTY